MAAGCGRGTIVVPGIVPADQIDALPTKPVNNVLDVVTADADADIQAIHPRIPAEQSQLGTEARLARDGLDLDCPRSDLGYFFRKEVGNVVRVVCHIVASCEIALILLPDVKAQMPATAERDVNTKENQSQQPRSVPAPC